MTSLTTLSGFITRRLIVVRRARNFFSLEYFDYESGSFVSPPAGDDRADDNSSLSGVISDDTWYDVRLTLNTNNTATGEYRVSALGDSGAWTLIGDGSGGADGDGTVDISDPGGFSPNFVGTRGYFNARIDDIVVIPEPSPLLLAVPGLFSLLAHGGHRRNRIR